MVPMRKQIWFGILVCVLAVIPGFVVGAIPAFLFVIFNVGDLGSNPDFLMLRSFFGLETPGIVWGWIFTQGIPALIQGGIAGSVAIYITHKLYTGNQLEIAAFTATALYAGMLLALTLFVMMTHGLEFDNIHDLLQIVGLGAGLISGAYALPARVSPVRPA
jgi:hypothetical protein